MLEAKELIDNALKILHWTPESETNNPFRSLANPVIDMFQQIDSIRNMALDETSMVLVMVLAVLSTPEKAENFHLIHETQSKLKHLLFRSLCSQMNHSGALSKMQDIEMCLKFLNIQSIPKQEVSHNRHQLSK